MASGTISGGNYNSVYSYYMTWTSVSNGSAANTSNVTLNWIMKKNTTDSYNAHNTSGSSKVTLVINGTSSGQMRADFDLRSAAVGTTKAIATFTLNNIPHNANGTCTINVSGTHATGLTSQTAGNWGTKSIGNTAITLDTIPRYATCNISLDNEYTDETAISVDWTSDSLIDRIWYSTDNGSTWLPNGGWSENASSGGIIIGALNPGTSYPIKIRVRRKDSQLLTDSAKSDFSTLSYPYVSKVGTTALTIGTQQTLTLYNPKSRSVTVYMKQNNTSGTQIYSGSSSTTSKQFTPDATTMYNLIPNAKSGNCVYYVTYKDSSNVTHTSATKSGTFVVNENNNRPSVSSSSAYDNNDTTYNLTRNRNKIVLNASNLALTISATAQNKATFNNGGYIKVNGTPLTLTISGSTATGVYNFNKPTTANYSVELKDSRGIITPNTSYTISNYVSYIVPTIIGTAVRNQPTDNKVNINGNGNFFNGSFGNSSNTLTATYTVKEKSTSTVLETGSMTVTKSGNTYTLAQKQVSNADYTKEYVATITVTDQLNTVTTNINIPKGQPIFWWNNENFNINGNTTIGGNATINNISITNALGKYIDTSGSDWKTMIKNKLDWCIANITTTQSKFQSFINGGWNGVRLGFGIFSKIDNSYQLIWISQNEICYCLKSSNNYTYKRQELYEDGFFQKIPNSSITIHKGTLSTNLSYKSDKSLNINMKIVGVTQNAGTILTIATIPYYASTEASLMAVSSNYQAIVCWLRNNGTIAIVSGTALNNAEIRIVGSLYID